MSPDQATSSRNIAFSSRLVWCFFFRDFTGNLSGGFHKLGYTPSHHPFVDRIFHETNRNKPSSSWGTPMASWSFPSCASELWTPTSRPLTITDPQLRLQQLRRKLLAGCLDLERLVRLGIGWFLMIFGVFFPPNWRSYAAWMSKKRSLCQNFQNDELKK